MVLRLSWVKLIVRWNSLQSTVLGKGSHPLCVEWLKMWLTSPGWVWFWFAVWKAGWCLIEVGVELQPLNGVEHPWLDALSELLQALGGGIRQLAKAALGIQ
jgi:hypothetical protein